MEQLSKQQTGTAIGGTIGAVLGNQFGGNNKVMWTTFGALGGALLGNQIGKFLDERDQQRMVQVTEQTIATGQTHTWSNPENNTRGEARVIATETKQEPVKVKVLKKKISKVPPLDIIGQTYRATTNSNLRGGPGTDYVVVGNLTENEIVNVVGKVRDKDWYLISHDGVGSGFIHTPLLEAAPTEAPTPPETPIAESDVGEEHVAANRVCRKIEQSVSLANGSSHTETIDACQGPTGWEVQA
ncbi:MAG: SH3 domain-containing protein [Nitrosomonas sp.]|nr:SH3 domain-containing protein [Nitrosomonas sp.]MCW5609053.1 SH3 domain-containing protein [Nitrosomonas sp.]